MGLAAANSTPLFASIFVGLLTAVGIGIYLRSEHPSADREALRHPVKAAQRALPRTQAGRIDRQASLRLAREAITRSRLVGGQQWLAALLVSPLFALAGLWNVLSPSTSAVNRAASAAVALIGGLVLYASVVLLFPRMHDVRDQPERTD